MAIGSPFGLALRPIQIRGKQATGLAVGSLSEDAADSSAAAGVQVGDKLVSMNVAPVRSVELIREWIENASKTTALPIQGGDTKTFLRFQVG